MRSSCSIVIIREVYLMKTAGKTLSLGVILVLASGVKSVTYFSENDIPEFGYLDLSVDPCDNIYAFSCGNFGKMHPRPSSAYLVDQFTLLEGELIRLGQEILSSPKSADDPAAVKKAKTAFQSCADAGSGVFVPQMYTVEEFGGMPLISELGGATRFSWREIGDLVAQYGVPLIFSYAVAQISEDESAIAIGADSLTNPALFTPRARSAYEEVLEEDFREAGRRRVRRSAQPAPFDVFLRSLAKNLLEHANSTKSDGEIVDELDQMANFMRQLYAGGIIDGDILPLDTQVTLGQLQEWTDNQFGKDIDLNWMDYLGRIFKMAGVTLTSDVKVYHYGIEKIYGTLNLVRLTDPAVVKNFALLRVFLFQAPDSDHATRVAFENYYRAKGYQLYPRGEYCARKILDIVDTASLSFAVTHAQTLYHFDINKIAQASEMVRNVQSVFRSIVASSDWMDSGSRDAALRKIANMLILLGYPDYVQDKDKLDEFYENLQICEWDNYGNSKNIRAFRQAYRFLQLGKPQRAFWDKSTFDPNAYYNRPNNKIVIPISMLYPVFFYGNNPILDYSRLGSIIGHEFTHGFDLNGQNYDENGVLRSWWSDQTMKAFEERTSCFKNQYSQYYVPEIDSWVNGSYSINENLADNGGVRESYRAFTKLARENGFAATGNYTLEQLFFIGYATMWCSEESDYALGVLVSPSSVYPPKRFRAIGALSNMAEFSEAFHCPVGSFMNPENKCLLWA